MEALKNLLIEEHNLLIQQLETKYLHYLNDLLKQKAFIHQKIQSSFYEKLFELNHIIQVESQSNYSTTIQHITDSEWTLSLPTLVKDIEIDYDEYRLNITNCPECNEEIEILTNMCHHIQSQHPDLEKQLIQHKIFKLCSKCYQSYHCTQKHLCDQNRLISSSNNNNNNNNDDKKKAELLKTEGNELLSQKKYQEAIDKYTKAINLNPMNAVYFSNRAAAQTKLKNYGQVAIDSRKASDIDPNYVKAYIREGLAEYQMKHYQIAYSAYSKALTKTIPIDDNQRRMFQQIQDKMKLCETKMNEPNNGDKWLCDYCHQIFTNNNSLKRHISTHNKKYMLSQIELNNKETNKTEWKNTLNHQYDKQYLKKKHGKYKKKLDELLLKCPKCGNWFAKHCELKEHLKLHEAAKQFVCNKCNKQFEEKKHLQRHIKNIHSNHDE